MLRKENDCDLDRKRIVYGKIDIGFPLTSHERLEYAQVGTIGKSMAELMGLIA